MVKLIVYIVKKAAFTVKKKLFLNAVNKYLYIFFKWLISAWDDTNGVHCTKINTLIFIIQSMLLSEHIVHRIQSLSVDIASILHCFLTVGLEDPPLQGWGGISHLRWLGFIAWGLLPLVPAGLPSKL